MIKFALKGGDPSAASAEAAVQDKHIAPVPRISIQAFCESADVAAAMQAASEDRRLRRCGVQRRDRRASTQYSDDTSYLGYTHHVRVLNRDFIKKKRFLRDESGRQDALMRY